MTLRAANYDNLLILQIKIIELTPHRASHGVNTFAFVIHLCSCNK